MSSVCIIFLQQQLSEKSEDLTSIIWTQVLNSVVLE
jgi:hypothetical protein